MNEANFPSGQWVGFYTYAHSRQRYLMDLILEFRDGLVSGEGADGLGFFGIDGRYYPQEGECHWIKTYFGRHSVEYAGFRETKGIWGTWTLTGAKGGFHIWPIGEGAPLEKLREEIEEKSPVLSPLHHQSNELPHSLSTHKGKPITVSSEVWRIALKSWVMLRVLRNSASRRSNCALTLNIRPPRNRVFFVFLAK